mmetsp:Transcript_38086/g.42127  ORF Transcript_38086/g.42127 Transcript_38086/m.42127 type:complete len:101 (-) Transcript_38086:609-911(-)
MLVPSRPRETGMAIPDPCALHEHSAPDFANASDRLAEPILWYARHGVAYNVDDWIHHAALHHPTYVRTLVLCERRRTMAGSRQSSILTQHRRLVPAFGIG